jgi:uncharacterized membrane protein YphA (DoxX/SURF4 family)
MIRVSVWTAIFLILLRICIGWHFAYEGYGKVKSAYQGKAAVNEKPFSSDAYFRESESAFGRLVKKQMPDPDQEVVDRLTLKPVDAEEAKTSPASRFPDALAKEWDDYFDRFAKQYRLDEQQLGEARRTFDQSKAQFVQWVGRVRTQDEIEKSRWADEKGTDKDKASDKEKEKLTFLTVKRKAPGGGNQTADFDEEMTPAERAAELKKKSDEVKAIYTEKLVALGRDVEGANLRAKKTEVNTIRTELQKELDDQTKAMKDALAKLFGPRVTAYAAKADDKDEGTTLQAMLTPMANGNNPLGKMWDEYAAYVKDFAPNLPDAKKAEIDAEVQAAKTRFDRWLNDQDMFTGEPLPQKDVAEWRHLYADARARREALAKVVPDPKKPEGQAKAEPAPEPVWLPKYLVVVLTQRKADADAEIKALTSRMQADLKTQSDAMRTQVGTPLLGDDRAKGYAAPDDGRRFLLVPKSWTLIDFIDWTTRWFLLVVGIMLMVGLCTRLSCFAAAGFLLLTILTQPAVPWLPAPPVSEGSYLFVNKNVIEMVALLALMTTRSGKWAGLDAILCGVFGRRRPKY